MTPGFTIDNLCKALGVHRNYSFLPLYAYMYVIPMVYLRVYPRVSGYASK